LIQIVLGVAAVAFGGYTAFARIAKPESLGKLEAMKEAYGDGAGGAIHLISYTLTPIAIGATLIVLGVIDK
jgi:hypothetical protein